MKYILGGGIAGQIFGYFNQEYKILDSDKSQESSRFSLGPRYIEETVDTRILLKFLEESLASREVKIGYFDKEKYVSFSSSFRERYALRSRGRKASHTSLMNSSEERMRVFELSPADLFARLKKENRRRLVKGSVTKINIKRKTISLEKETPLRFSELVSTIPLDVLFNLCRKENTSLKRGWVTFAKIRESYFDMKDFEFVYCLGKPFYRISKHKGYLVAELRGQRDQKSLHLIFGEDLLDSEQRLSQILAGRSLKSFEGISLLGRYAQWDRSVKIEDVAASSCEKYLKRID
jgi:hypothetical protein